jgi:hypothetical protein
MTAFFVLLIRPLIVSQDHPKYQFDKTPTQYQFKGGVFFEWMLYDHLVFSNAPAPSNRMRQLMMPAKSRHIPANTSAFNGSLFNKEL